jgi:radical SAM superfamily enzyme YgiQ (UPF0313 family)
MKISLINPPRSNEIIGNNPSIIEEERGFNPPLGLLYIAGYLQKYSNHKIKIIDAQVEKYSYNDLNNYIDSNRPDIVGITAMTMTIIDVMKTANLIKEIDPSIIVVLGGPHVNLFPEETIRHSSIDYLVLGEGEEIFLDLVNSIDTQKSASDIQGLVYLENGNVINTGTRSFIKDLDSLPYPARQLTPYKKYNSLLSKGEIVTTIFTSRGCPFKCSFCDRPNLGKVFRSRSANNVVGEIEECVKLGIRDFLFYDDTFTVDRKRVIQICKKIIEKELKIRWDIRARVDTIDEEMLFYLKTAGCEGIHYGIEAGTEKVLKELNKGITINQVKKTFKLTKKYKIPTLAYFMIGNPNETVDDIESTFRLMKELNPDYVHITILTPFPGTQIYIKGLKSGAIKYDYWKEFAEDPDNNFIPPIWQERFSRDELNKYLVKGYKKFYVRPYYIMRQIKNLKSINELRKKAFAGIKVIMMK